MRRSVSLLLCTFLSFALAGPAAAIPTDDPPLFNWTETWIMPTPGSDSPVSVEFASGSNDWELFPISPDVQVGPDCEEECDPTGIIVTITLPNFVDPLPRKHIDVLFEGANPDPSILPSVIDVTGFDIPFGSDQQEFDVLVGFDAPGQMQLIPTDGGLIKTELWKILPNPDYEIIRVFIPFEFEWVKLHITTQSLGRVVPEPSALVLASVGMLGLLVMGRRRS